MGVVAHFPWIMLVCSLQGSLRTLSCFGVGSPSVATAFNLRALGITSVSFTSARKAVTSASGTASFYKLLTAKVTAFLEWLKQVL
jgi:hypothetical protein